MVSWEFARMLEKSPALCRDISRISWERWPSFLVECLKRMKQEYHSEGTPLILFLDFTPD